MTGSQFLPACFIHLPVKAGQHHAAARQAGDDRQKPRRGRDRAGGARRYDRPGWRAGAQLLRLGADEGGAARGGAHEAALVQFARIFALDQLQQVARRQPVFGALAGQELADFIEIQFLVLEIVDEAGQRAGQLHGLAGMLAEDVRKRPAGVVRGPLIDQPGEQEAPGQRRDGGGQTAERIG